MKWMQSFGTVHITAVIPLNADLISGDIKPAII